MRILCGASFTILRRKVVVPFSRTAALSLPTILWVRLRSYLTVQCKITPGVPFHTIVPPHGMDSHHGLASPPRPLLSDGAVRRHQTPQRSPVSAPEQPPRSLSDE